jgi:acyl-CoA reductase-like NAD-dependent aldehyde dehydrogenase
MILATGGAAMVRAAYSSGTPAIGVGPGNGPAYIERSADIEKAVSWIISSKTFDNGTICASEQSVICENDMRDKVQAEMERQGAYFLNDEQSKQLGGFILKGNGTMNPLIVGKTAQAIADLAGLSIPTKTKVLVALEDGVGRGHPYSNEKLAPILAFYTEENYKDVCLRCSEILHYEGAGHTFSIHTKDEKMVDYFSFRIPASRILVNTSSTLGAIGATTALMPAFTLGCGAVGGSATSDNVGPMNLINLRMVAYGIKDMEEIRKEVSDSAQSISKSTETCSDRDPDIDVNEIVEKIIERLKAV